MTKKRTFIGAISTFLLSALFVVTASAAPTAAPSKSPVATAPGQDKLLCFDGTTDGTTYGGTCTLQGNGAKGPATLSNASSNTSGDYSGVYLKNTNLSGQLLTDINMLGYMYKSSTTPTPGALSLNLPISENGSMTVDGYAFIDAYYCPGTNGKVDVINDATCSIWYKGTEYSSWAQFVAAYQGATVASAGAVPFIVAERTGGEPSATWTINNVMLGKPGAAKTTPTVSPSVSPTP